MNMKKVIGVIDTLRNGWYNPPSSYGKQKKIDFIHQSYSHSAINEIKFYLMEHENEDPIKAIEDFRYKMDCFACDTKNSMANFMFSTYYDVATDVLDLLITIKK